MYYRYHHIHRPVYLPENAIIYIPQISQSITEDFIVKNCLFALFGITLLLKVGKKIAANVVHQPTWCGCSPANADSFHSDKPRHIYFAL